jgi:hypothetical protein
MAHADLNMLKDSLLPVAKKMLTEHGEFFPYGQFMKQNGEIVDCAVSGEDENPPAKELIEILTSDFQKRAAKGEIRAAGICCDVKVATPEHPEKMDAIQFALEHQNGETVDVFLPYDLDSSGEVVYGKIFATTRKKEFFF